ncbi:MAG: helix-hairpin-helix domain-containing protein [Burkholderiaceae bacterium]|jgi:competence protein ComEA
MIRTLVTLLVAAFAFAAHAAVDVNKASQAELETIKGIGPNMSGKILDERKKGSFKDWSDVVSRVKGVGPGNATRFSADGLTVNGSAFKAELVASNKSPAAADRKNGPAPEAPLQPAASPRK